MFDHHRDSLAGPERAAPATTEPAPAPAAGRRGPLDGMPAVPPVPEVRRAVAEVVAAVAGLRSAARQAPTAVERANWLLGLRQVVDAAEAGFTEVLGRFDALGDGQVLTGAASTAGWCRTELRLGSGDASSRVRLARLAATEPAVDRVLEQVADGELRYEQARQISHSVRALDGDERQPAAVEVLTELAATADPAAIVAAGRHLRDVVNPDGTLPSQEQEFSRRYLSLSPLLGGMTAVDGLLDSEATATLSAALAPLMVPAGPDDSRSSAQRRADGLAELAALALRTDELPRLSGTAASVDVLISARALVDPTGSGRPGAASMLGSHRAAWSGSELAGVVLDHPGRPALLPPTSVARLLCDFRVGRIVLGADGIPLDLGRRVRTFSADQRRALSVRDAGCRFPGCDRPPRYTDVHHVVPWAQGGLTDLANGLLLCRWHHGRVHAPAERGGWRVTPVDDARGSHGPLLFRNDFGTELTSDPRGP